LRTMKNSKPTIDEIYRKKPKSDFRRKLSYTLQAAGAFPLMFIVRCLPLDVASALGARIARFVGPRLKEHKVAMMNLALAFPDKTEAERNAIIMAEWENIGRVIGEFPHVTRPKVIAERVKIKGKKYLDELKKSGKGAVCVSIHMGNWELSSMIMRELGIKANNVYRRPNNPYVEKIYQARVDKQKGLLIPKDKNSLLKMIRCIRNGETVGLLIDQKLNEGIETTFFGKKAMTTPAPAIISRRYDVPILMGRVVRTKGAHFEMTLFPLIYCNKTKNSDKDIQEMTQKLNDIVQGWIETTPEQWLWIHKRWNKDIFK